MSERCAEDDPRRCIGVNGEGQCAYIAEEGRRFCSFHAGFKVDNDPNKVKQAVNQFLIERESLRKPYERHNSRTDYLELKDTIALLRMMIERRLNQAETAHEEIAAFRDVDGFMKNLLSMCVSLKKLQEQMGLVLGKDELRVFAKEIGTILVQELDGIEGKEEKIDRICERIFTSLDKAGKKDE